MLNKEKHQLIMGQILKDIYTDTLISSLLGFKGGTCAYFFYELDRFSVDLDFDLIQVSKENKEKVFERIIFVLNKYGEVKNKHIKRYTLFALLSYGDEDRNIKIEINTRGVDREYYEIKDYIGIPILVAKKDYLFSSKLVALTSRKQLAMRDIYDVHFFIKHNWEINETIIKKRTGKDLEDYLNECVELISGVKDTQIMQGLGDLISTEKEKAWIKSHLKADTIFLLKNYIRARFIY